jgi:hypothetical protein
MVDIQTISVSIAAVSVVLYILNLYIASRREEKNKKITLTNTLLQNFLSEKGSQTWAELMNIKWSSFDDFIKRYDSSVNPEHFGKRWSTFSNFDVLGHMLRNGLVDEDTVYKGGGYLAIQMWARYKPLVEEYRKIAYGKTHFSDFEYLANEMWRRSMRVDPGYTRDQTNFSDDSMQRAFENVKP